MLLCLPAFADTFEVTLKTKSNLPRANTVVTFKQISNEVAFGLGPSVFVNPTGTSYLDNFDLAVIPFYWAYVEPEKGKFNLAQQRIIVDWCKNNRKKTRGHPVIYDLVYPSWKTGKVTLEDEISLVQNIMHAFPDVDMWDLVNEPIHMGTPAKEIYLFAKSYSNYLQINEYGVLPYDSIGFKEYLTKFQNYDSIGLQCHIPANEKWNIERVVAQVKSYQELGKPVHITEISIATQPEAGISLWDEASQAEYLVQLYKALFDAKVASITYWNLFDGDPWRPSIGLIRENGTPKPAWAAVNEFIQSVRTVKTTKTNSRGVARFEGYPGTYAVITSNQIRGYITLKDKATVVY